MNNQDLIDHLDTVHGYDFIYEILQVRQVGGRVEIDYRGVHGEYGMIPITGTLAEVTGALL